MRLRIVKKHKNELGVLFVLLSVLIFGVVAFSYFEGKGIWDSLYWVLVTVTTVGYGDFYPETPGGRITFALVALGGIGAIAFVIEELVSFSTRAQLMKLFGLGEEKMKGHTIIVGWNTTVEEAIKELKKEDVDFLVVDSESELSSAELDAMGIPHIVGDPTKSETLKRCNIEKAKAIMIALKNDADMIMVALISRRQNRSIEIVATCNSREHVEMMKEAGIAYIIPYAEISGRLLAHALTEPVVVNFINDAATAVVGIDLKQIKVSERKKLSDISLSSDEKVIALYRNGRFIINFSANVVAEEGDYLIAIAEGK